MKFSQYLTRCACGNQTSKKYARSHDGKCKSCFTGEPIQELDTNAQAKTMCRFDSNTPTREQRILDHGYQAYAREEGHYDHGDY